MKRCLKCDRPRIDCICTAEPLPEGHGVCELCLHTGPVEVLVCPDTGDTLVQCRDSRACDFRLGQEVREFISAQTAVDDSEIPF